MAFVKFTVSANNTGIVAVEVYEISDEVLLKDNNTIDKDLLDELGYDLVNDNVNINGTKLQGNSCKLKGQFSFSYELIMGTVEEIEQKYGNISKF